MIRTYSELMKRDTQLGRFRYLNLGSEVGVSTFGSDRPFNQTFYSSYEWKKARDLVIIRDNGCDMALPGWEIEGHPHVHHMNPLEIQDIIHKDLDRLFNPEYLILVSFQTHNAIHFGDENQLPSGIIERRPGDTTLW